MTISTLQSQITVGGNGASTVFDFPFVGDSTADIAVIYTQYSSPGVVLSVTTLSPSQYSVVFSPIVVGSLWAVGGSITYPLSGTPIPAPNTLTIQRVIPLTQETDISNQGDFYPTVTETAVDIIEMQLQQVAARTGQLRGTWLTNTNYNYGDVIIDGVNGSNSGSYYMCAMSNISGVWTTDLANGDWVLAIPATIPIAPLPLSITNGGTGATTAAAALSDLGAVGLTAHNIYTNVNDFTTGAIAVPTQGAGDSSPNAASTAFVNSTPLTLASGSTAATQSAGDNSTKVANTAFVATAVTSITSLTGAIIMWTRSTAPSGYLECNGSAISRTTFAALFAICGTTFGSGDGSTTFNIPDMRGYFPRGWANSGSIDSGRGFGTTQSDAFAAHTHQAWEQLTSASGSLNGAATTAANTAKTGTASTNANFVTAATGGSETRPINLALMFIIKT